MAQTNVTPGTGVNLRGENPLIHIMSSTLTQVRSDGKDVPTCRTEWKLGGENPRLPDQAPYMSGETVPFKYLSRLSCGNFSIAYRSIVLGICL